MPHPMAEFTFNSPQATQGCPMVALEQILHSEELRICFEALAPKMGLEQIRQNICSNWSIYLLPKANPLICQNGMEEPLKCTILRLKFQNFLTYSPQNGMEELPKCTKRSQFQNFLGVTPKTPQGPPNRREMPLPYLPHSALCASHNTLFAPRKPISAPSIFNLDNLAGTQWLRPFYTALGHQLEMTWTQMLNNMTKYQ